MAMEVNAVVAGLAGGWIAEHLDELLMEGADANLCAQKMGRENVYKALPKLLKYGADPTLCAERMGKERVAKRADTLKAAGVSEVDLYRLSGGIVKMNPLRGLGDTPAAQELEDLLERTDSETASRYAVELYDAGVPLARIRKVAGGKGIGKYIPEFLDRGIEVDKLIKLSSFRYLVQYRTLLQEKGGKDVDRKIFLQSKIRLSPEYALALHCECEGIASKLLKQMESEVVAECYSYLITCGYDARDLAAKLSSSALRERIVQLLEAGVDPEWIAGQLEPVDLLFCAIPLGDYGVTVDIQGVTKQIRQQKTT